MSAILLDSRTTFPKVDPLSRKWYLIDAKDLILGRLSTRIATILMGKIKPVYAPSVDCGDFVIVVNVDHMRLTGKKLDQKIIFHHTNHPGGARPILYKKLMAEKPDRALQLAVKRMLPRKRISSRQILRLKMYRGGSHPHGVQNPETIGLS